MVSTNTPCGMVGQESGACEPRAIVVFRFHGRFATCLERVRLIRALNPCVAVYGLYGGPSGRRREAAHVVGRVLDGIWFSSTEDRRWKWQHQDQLVREWF